MFLRVIKRRDKDGVKVQYLALAVSERLRGKKYPQIRIIHSFGRATPKLTKSLERLTVSIQKYIDMERKSSSDP